MKSTLVAEGSLPTTYSMEELIHDLIEVPDGWQAERRETRKLLRENRQALWKNSDDYRARAQAANSRRHYRKHVKGMPADGWPYPRKRRS